MTEQWPPDWEDLDSEDQDSEDQGFEDQDSGAFETADLAEVTAALGSIPMPSLPGAFEARISAVIAAEAATRTESTSAAEESATARSSSSDGASPAAARGGTATAPRRRSRRASGRPAPSRPPGQRLRRLLSAPVLGTLAVCLLFAGFGYLASRSSSSSSSSYSSAEAAPAAAGASHASAAFGGSRTAAGSVASGAARTDNLPDTHAGFTVADTATKYQPATLAGQVRTALTNTSVSAQTPTATVPVPSAAASSAAASTPASASASAPSALSLSVPSTALAGCVDSLTQGAAPRLVDRASYAGKPAYIIAVASRVWVVGLGCTATNHELITTIALTG